MSDPLVIFLDDFFKCSSRRTTPRHSPHNSPKLASLVHTAASNPPHYVLASSTVPLVSAPTNTSIMPQIHPASSVQVPVTLSTTATSSEAVASSVEVFSDFSDITYCFECVKIADQSSFPSSSSSLAISSPRLDYSVTLGSITQPSAERCVGCGSSRNLLEASHSQVRLFVF
jgi:hypothetical protein